MAPYTRFLTVPRRRKHGGDRLGKSLQAIDDSDQNVLDAPVLEFGHDAQPEFGAFRGLDPKAQDVLGSFRRDAERDIDGLVANEPLVADFDPQRVEENQRINGL